MRSPRGGSRPGRMSGSPTPGAHGLIKSLDPHDGAVTRLLTVGAQIWSACTDGSIRIWEIETGQTLEDRKQHTGPILDLILVKDKIWSSAKDRSILIWTAKKALPEKKVVLTHKEKDKELWVNCMMEADQFIWAGCNDGMVRLVESKSGKIRKELKVEGAPSAITCFIKNSNTMWCGTASGVIYIWNSTTLKVVKKLLGHSGSVNSFTSIGPSSYSFEIWSCSTDLTIRCWSAEHHDNIKTVSCRCNTLCLMQARSSHHVWCGTAEGSIHVWDAKTYEMVHTIPEQQEQRIGGGITCLTTAEKTNEIWSGSENALVSVWK